MKLYFTNGTALVKMCPSRSFAVVQLRPSRSRKPGPRRTPGPGRDGWWPAIATHMRVLEVLQANTDDTAKPCRAPGTAVWEHVPGLATADAAFRCLAIAARFCRTQCGSVANRQRPLLKGGACGAEFRRPMLTSARKEASIRSALNPTSTTDPGMLPQFQALEGSPADMPGRARNGANRIVGGQAARGESGSGRRHRNCSRDSEGSASRAFVVGRRGDPLMPCHPVRARTFLKWETATMHGTRGPAFVPFLNEGVSCGVDR